MVVFLGSHDLDCLLLMQAVAGQLALMPVANMSLLHCLVAPNGWLAGRLAEQRRDSKLAGNFCCLAHTLNNMSDTHKSSLTSIT